MGKVSLKVFENVATFWSEKENEPCQKNQGSLLPESYSQPPPREHPKLILGGRWGLIFPLSRGFSETAM